MSTPKKPKAAAWFYERDECVAKAVAYVEAHLKAYHATGKHLYDAELRSFGESQTAKVIYESNLIENAGLSEGETRRLVFDYQPGDQKGESTHAKQGVSGLSIEEQKSVQQLAEMSAMQFEREEPEDQRGYPTPAGNKLRQREFHHSAFKREYRPPRTAFVRQRGPAQKPPSCA